MGTISYLLDTHTFLWAVRESSKLSPTAKKTMERASDRCFVSAVSAYEILNKHRIGKLLEYAPVAENYQEVLRKFGAKELPINTRHAHYAGKLDWAHRDPFDRLLAAQTFIEELILITNDSAFDSLPWLNVLW